MFSQCLFAKWPTGITCTPKWSYTHKFTGFPDQKQNCVCRKLLSKHKKKLIFLYFSAGSSFEGGYPAEFHDSFDKSAAKVQDYRINITLLLLLLFLLLVSPWCFRIPPGSRLNHFELTNERVVLSRRIQRRRNTATFVLSHLEGTSLPPHPVNELQQNRKIKL